MKDEDLHGVYIDPPFAYKLLLCYSLLNMVIGTRKTQSGIGLPLGLIKYAQNVIGRHTALYTVIHRRSGYYVDVNLISISL